MKKCVRCKSKNAKLLNFDWCQCVFAGYDRVKQAHISETECETNYDRVKKRPKRVTEIQTDPTRIVWWVRPSFCHNLMEITTEPVNTKV